MTPEIQVKLAGKDQTLRFTLRAWKEVTGYFGNFLEAFQKLAVFDGAAYVAIVAAGLGKSRSDVEEMVAFSRLSDLTKPLTEYVELLSNGGHPKSDDDGKSKTGEA